MTRQYTERTAPPQALGYARGAPHAKRRARRARREEPPPLPRPTRHRLFHVAASNVIPATRGEPLIARAGWLQRPRQVRAAPRPQGTYVRTYVRRHARRDSSGATDAGRPSVGQRVGPRVVSPPLDTRALSRIRALHRARVVARQPLASTPRASGGALAGRPRQARGREQQADPSHTHTHHHTPPPRSHRLSAVALRCGRVPAAACAAAMDGIPRVTSRARPMMLLSAHHQRLGQSSASCACSMPERPQLNTIRRVVIWLGLWSTAAPTGVIIGVFAAHPREPKHVI